MSQTPITQTTSATTEKISSKKKRGRPTGWRKNKTEAAPAIEDIGNPDFNLSDAEPVDYSEGAMPTNIPPLAVDLEAMERQRFGKKPAVHQKAMAAITPEDLAIDMQLQAMLNENPMPDLPDNEPVKPVQPERREDCLLSDLAPETKVATTLHELEHQVMQAKMLGADAIEADEKIIRYFTRANFQSDVSVVGFFMYKDIKVFLPERFKTTKNTDRENMFMKLHEGKK